MDTQNDTNKDGSLKRNFDYLKNITDFADLYALCNEAEIWQLSDPIKSALSSRKALEYLVKTIYLLKDFPIDKQRPTLYELVEQHEFKEFINDDELMRALHFIRKAGNNAAHNITVTKKDAFFSLLNLHNFVGSLLMMLDVIDIFPRFDQTLLTKKIEVYVAPKIDEEPKPTLIDKYDKLAKETLTLSKLPEYFTEAETRELYINMLLREAGWKVLTDTNIISANSVGIEIEVTGMPNQKQIGYVDYVIFGLDGKPLALIEAKKASVDPIVGKHQAELYAQCLEEMYGVKPIIYYTNGYEIYCIDSLGYPPRRLYGFHSRKNLELLIQRQDRKPITDITIDDNITNREYQKRAIISVCEHFNNSHRRGLLVMATGSGKTRVSISLVDVLMRNGWVKDVLFLADRTALVKQAHKNYTKLLPHVTTSMLSDRTQTPDKNARVLFSTYQTMINFIDSDLKEFSIGRFDLIIIDEAHRSIFGKYMSIFNYFDAFLVGLTATPRDEVDKSTYDMFYMEQGEPNFAYELDEAVKDGFLIDYQLLNRKSEILSKGIKYDDLSDEEKEQLDKIYEYENEENETDLLSISRRDINPKEIFKYLYNEDTVDKVLQDLMTNGLKIKGGDEIGKTIIFASNHKHAVQIVERFNILYPQYGPAFCVLIDNTVNYSQDIIDTFEIREKLPQIAVSVDMLDTGIDVPDILNLVFFKVVKSKIKFQQMIGRGTRLSEDIFGIDKDKEEFYIFDFCGNFDYFRINAKESATTRMTSITEKLFSLKLDIAIALQEYRYQENPYLKQYHDSLKAELQKQIKDLNRNFIDVRSEWAMVDKYSTDKAWEYVSLVEGHGLKNHIAKLIQPTLEEENLKRFDHIILLMEFSYVDEEIIPQNQIERTVKIADTLLEKTSIPQIMDKIDILKEVKTEQFWGTISVEKLERIRKQLRDLMIFLEKKDTRTFVIDITDTLTYQSVAGKPNLPPVSYKQRIMDYLSENSNNPVIQKIRNLEQLNHNDILQLEKVLWEELGSKEDYENQIQNQFQGGNVAVFIRSLIGVNHSIALEKFSNFIDINTLNSDQLEYIKTIIDYVSINGDIDGNTITNKEPFTEFKWLDVYGDKLAYIGKYVSALHEVIVVA